MLLEGAASSFPLMRREKNQDEEPNGERKQEDASHGLLHMNDIS
jgi:hypothetical protein